MDRMPLLSLNADVATLRKQIDRALVRCRKISSTIGEEGSRDLEEVSARVVVKSIDSALSMSLKLIGDASDVAELWAQDPTTALKPVVPKPKAEEPKAETPAPPLGPVGEPATGDNPILDILNKPGEETKPIDQ